MPPSAASGETWHTHAPRVAPEKRPSVMRPTLEPSPGRESDPAFVRRVLDRDLGKSGELLVLNDEAHHAYRRVRASGW